MSLVCAIQCRSSSRIEDWMLGIGSTYLSLPFLDAYHIEIEIEIYMGRSWTGTM